MPSPIELTFGAGESLGTLDSVTIGVGGVWGSVTMPFTPLEFTRERIARAFGQRFADESMPVNNERFYWDRYIQLPVSLQPQFHGTPVPVSRRVRGISVGINEGGVLSEAGDLAVQGSRSLGRAVGWGVGRVFSAGASYARVNAARAFGFAVSNFLQRVGLDRMQSSQTLNATLYGMNHNDTYNMAMASFTQNPALNICMVGGAASAIVQAAGSVAFIGPFGSARDIRLNPLYTVQDTASYLYNVATRSYAYCFLRDAAIGLIVPGAQVQLVAS